MKLPALILTTLITLGSATTVKAETNFDSASPAQAETTLAQNIFGNILHHKFRRHSNRRFRGSRGRFHHGGRRIHRRNRHFRGNRRQVHHGDRRYHQPYRSRHRRYNSHHQNHGQHHGSRRGNYYR